MIVVLDIETQDLVPENKDLSVMRVSIAGVHDGKKAVFFSEDQLDELFKVLDVATLIAGHNLFGFDYKVLQRYAHFDVRERYAAKTFDMLKCLLHKTDRLISLNDLALRTLGIQKSGKGADAPKLFHEGNIAQLQAYLEQDLRVTRALVEHIQKKGTVKYGHIIYKEPVEREIALSIDER
jgi:hypothetical protein